MRKEALNFYVIINSNVQRVWGFCGGVGFFFFFSFFSSSLHALNEFHLPASWGDPSQGWSLVLTMEGIHSLLSSMGWVCPSLAPIPLQLVSFTGATLLSTALLGQWIGHTGSLPSLAASMSPSLLSLRGLCSQPPGNASKQNPSSLLISSQALTVTTTLFQPHRRWCCASISLSLALTFVACKGKLGSEDGHGHAYRVRISTCADPALR